MKNWFWLILAFVPFLVSMSGCLPLVAVGATAGGVMMATDRRTVGSQIDDTSIETKILFKINDRYGDRVHVNVTSYNGVVLLTGEVPNNVTSHDCQDIALRAERVRAVQNELLVGEQSSVGSRADDTYITSKVKARFVDSDFSTRHIKVVTERGIVYLMGLVTRKEGSEATEIARRTSGVKQVIRIFEYLD